MFCQLQLSRSKICLQCGRPRFDSCVGKIPWRRKWQSTPALLPGKSHGRRSLIGCSPWGGKESDTTSLSLSVSWFFGVGFHIWYILFNSLLFKTDSDILPIWLWVSQIHIPLLNTMSCIDTSVQQKPWILILSTPLVRTWITSLTLWKTEYLESLPQNKLPN